jgi:hypothetical protein
MSFSLSLSVFRPGNLSQEASAAAYDERRSESPVSITAAEYLRKIMAKVKTIILSINICS